MPANSDPWNLARQEVEEACARLIDPSPENLDRSSGMLRSAVDHLTNANRPAADEARHLRRSIHRARHLLESAADYHRQWRRILQAMTAGYTSAGEAASLSARGRVSMQG